MNERRPAPHSAVLVADLVRHLCTTSRKLLKRGRMRCVIVIAIASHFAQWIRLSISAAHKMTRGSCTSQKCIIARPLPYSLAPNAFGGNAEVCVPRPPGRRKKPVVSVRVRTSPVPCFSQVLGLICMHSPFWRYPPPSSLIGFSNYAPLFVLCQRRRRLPC